MLPDGELRIDLLQGGAGKDSRGKGSQVHCTLELRDCESGLNGVLILQNQLQTDTTARHRPCTAPTDRQAHDQ